jgi:annexin A7/11
MNLKDKKTRIMLAIIFVLAIGSAYVNIVRSDGSPPTSPTDPGAVVVGPGQPSSVLPPGVAQPQGEVPPGEEPPGEEPPEDAPIGQPKNRYPGASGIDNLGRNPFRLQEMPTG